MRTIVCARSDNFVLLNIDADAQNALILRWRLAPWLTVRRRCNSNSSPSWILFGQKQRSSKQKRQCEPVAPNHHVAPKRRCGRAPITKILARKSARVMQKSEAEPVGKNCMKTAGCGTFIKYTLKRGQGTVVAQSSRFRVDFTRAFRLWGADARWELLSLWERNNLVVVVG